MSFWVYMLECADRSYYVGHTDELEKRVLQHERGELGGYTSTRRPVRVVFTQEFASREEALAAERQIKGWSRKKKARWRAAIGSRCRGWRNAGSRSDERTRPGHRPSILRDGAQSSASSGGPEGGIPLVLRRRGVFAPSRRTCPERVEGSGWPALGSPEEYVAILMNQSTKDCFAPPRGSQ